MNIVEAMTDNHLFGLQFGGESWHNWRVLLGGFYGLETDATKFKHLTQREPPLVPLDELWLVVGRRGGKSQIAALLAVYEAIFNDYSDRLAAGEVATIAVIAADRKQARTIIRYINGLLENPMLKKLVYRESAESIELTNRCAIEVFTASHRTTRGYTLACAILDEVAFWHSDGANPDKEILNALRPSLASLNGKIVALSSPYARRGVLWDTYKTHHGKTSNILVAQGTSREMNPSLSQVIVDRAMAEDSASASAEYLANFRSDVETFVTIEVVQKCTRPSPMMNMYDSKLSYKAFVDPSGGMSDAFTMAISHKEGELIIVDHVAVVRPPFSPESVTEEFCKTLKSYRIHTVVGDAYAGEWPREQFMKRGISYLKSDKNKSELYKELLPLLNSERIELPPMQTLERELIQLERRTTRGGRDSIDHPPSGHDDIANVVAGAAARHTGQTSVANPFPNQTDIYGYYSPKTYGYRMNA